VSKAAYLILRGMTRFLSRQWTHVIGPRRPERISGGLI
jgi:hypothetical protein